MSKELISQFYSSDLEVKRAAVYRVLFDRRQDLLPELKKAISFEQNEQVAVFMMQVILTVEAFPRDFSIERRILELLQKGTGAGELQPSMWKYLCGHGTSQMLIATLGAMGEAIPPDALEFIEACVNHPDPEVRAMACEKAIKSGRPTHFAYVLNLITDPDPHVSETAFSVIHSMPVNELAIVLDYALGSPDEWVLENVAPFLPNIVNNGLRQVISKFQYHKHPLVSRKAREALKALDAIPYVTKRAAEKAEDEKPADPSTLGSGKEQTADTGSSQPAEKGPSFKEQMELKRLQKIEEERRRKEEEEALAKALGEVKPEDLASFAGDLADFDAVASGNSRQGITDEGLPTEEAAFSENKNFETEAAMLEAIDENTIIVDETPAVVHENIDLDNGINDDNSTRPAIHDGIIDLEGANIIITEETSAKASGKGSSPVISRPGDAADENAVTKRAEEVSQKAAPENPAIDGMVASPPGRTVAATATTGGSYVSETASGQKDRPKEGAIEKQSGKIQTPMQTPSVAIPTRPAKPAVLAGSPVANISGVTLPGKAPPINRQADNAASASASGKAQGPALKKQVNSVQAVPGAAVPGPAREIITRYPSFLSDPFALLFQPARPDVQLKLINQVTDNLIAFLNLCFMQSCMFYAEESDVLARSVKECLKGNLTGPTALRCLHNFVLSMKAARGNPVFFTFSLSGILSESSDTNPLMMMRELKEYLRDPVLPLEESVPQAIEGLTEILRGVKSILNNTLVMRAPAGAKEPFADLSGPEARILPGEKRPGLELPVGEVVLISRDGTEAFGLFPYFKYAKKKVLFARPDAREVAILYERLEIPADQA